MITLVKAAYRIDVACAFVYGLLIPWLAPKNAFAEITDLLEGSPFGITVVVTAITSVTIVLLSALTMYIMVRVTYGQPPIIFFLLKLFVLALPAVAVGMGVSMILAFLGVYEIAQPYSVWGVSAMAWL